MASEQLNLSDLTAEQFSLVKRSLLSCYDIWDQLGVGEDNEDVRKLNQIVNKLTETKLTSFSDVSLLFLGKMGIRVHPMRWSSGGETEAKTLGNLTSPGALTVEDTRKNVHNILKYVSLESEAGCRVLINSILIHVASNLETATSGVVIAPEFRIENGGIVDYMLLYGDKEVRDEIIISKSFAFSNSEVYKSLRCNVYEAKPEELFSPTTALPQAAMAAIIRAQHLKLNTFRGCVTCGKRWIFFVYNAENPEQETHNTVHWFPAISLGEGHNTTLNLDLILGLLRDWVEHGQNSETCFFKYSKLK